MNIITACTGLEGNLTLRECTLLKELLRQPTQSLWEQAQNIVISPLPFLTVAMAVEKISQRGTAEIPDLFTLYHGLRYAVEERGNYLQEPFPLTCHAFIY